jgi:hypothetical protein
MYTFVLSGEALGPPGALLRRHAALLLALRYVRRRAALVYARGSFDLHRDCHKQLWQESLHHLLVLPTTSLFQAVMTTTSTQIPL